MLLVDEDVGDGALVGDLLESGLNVGAVIYESQSVYRSNSLSSRTRIQWRSSAKQAPKSI